MDRAEKRTFIGRVVSKKQPKPLNCSLESTVKSLQVSDGGIARAKSARRKISLLNDDRLRSDAEHLLLLAMPKESGGDSEANEKVMESLDRLSVPKLEQVFSAVGSELGPHLARAWKTLCRLPQPSTVKTVPARFPQAMPATRLLRWVWLSEVLTILYRFPDGRVTPQWLAIHGADITQETGAEALHRLYGLSTDGTREQDSVGRLLGSVIARRDQVARGVFKTLVAILRGEHPVGQAGGHVYRALWISGRQEARELLCERLRTSDDEAEAETIVRASAEGGPEAIVACIRQVAEIGHLDRDAVAMVIGSWFGLELEQANLEGQRVGLVEPFLRSLERRLQQDSPRFESRQSDVTTAYIELVTESICDAAPLPQRAIRWLDRVESGDQLRIVQAVRQVRFPDESNPALENLWLRILDSEDVRVAALAIWWKGDYRTASGHPQVENAERLAEVIQRVKDRLKGRRGKLLSAPWQTVPAARKKLVEMIASVADSLPLSTLLKFASDAQTVPRVNPAFQERLQSPRDAEERELIVQFLRRNTRYNAVPILPGLIRNQLSPDDIVWLASYVEVTNSSPRPAAAEIIARHGSSIEVRTFIEMLLSNKRKPFRLGGLCILASLVVHGKDLAWVATTVADFGAKSRITSAERSALESLRESLSSESLIDENNQ